MNRLEELIKEYCPDGVEYKKLKDVAMVTSGSSAPQKADSFCVDGIPFCRTSDVGKAHLSIDFSDIADKITAQA